MDDDLRKALSKKWPQPSDDHSLLNQVHAWMESQASTGAEKWKGCDGQTEPHNGSTEVDPDLVREFHRFTEVV